ncbi:MAG: hypothetical protein AB7S38_10945 [Vulcanimicrobiota bacterium]
MEPVLRSFLFCDSVVPAHNGKLTCYGLFSDLYSATFPVTHPKFSILTTWGSGTGFHVQIIKMFNPAKTVLLNQSPEMYFTLEEESQTVHVQVDVNQVVFTDDGAYYFQVYLDNRMVAEHTLNYRRIG